MNKNEQLVSTCDENENNIATVLHGRSMNSHLNIEVPASTLCVLLFYLLSIKTSILARSETKREQMENE